LALASIRKLKRLAREEGAELWPNHDLAFWRGLRRFPEFHE
jgi:N-acyl homoserine lactone hydrolase